MKTYINEHHTKTLKQTNPKCYITNATVIYLLNQWFPTGGPWIPRGPQTDF